MHCLAVSLPGFEEDLDWGEQKYIDFLVIRAQMMKALTEVSIEWFPSYELLAFQAN